MMKTSRPNHIDYAKVIGMYIVVFYHYAYYAAASLALCYPLILLASKYWPALMGNRRVA